MPGAEQNLRAGLHTLQLELNAQQVRQLLDYLALIGKWTKVYNLTAVRDPAEMMTLHILDSLAAIAPLKRHLQQAGLGEGGRLLDVGSGAGLPGVVMAICCPALNVSCVDAVAKKAAFIKQAALALKLPNLHGLHARVENIAEPFDVICSRAFASLHDFTHWSAGALAPAGVWMAMKGRHPAD
ncbi:MAG: 16S rRNA (guanine(527)-N(7))-methyltransferase RsmG, partial [Polaromonas sp.]